MTTYNRAKWLGLTTGTVSGFIRIKADPVAHTPSASPSPLSITNVTVAGVRIIELAPSPALTITDTTNAAQRATLASNLAATINNYSSTPEYTATVSGDLVTITPACCTYSAATIVVTTTTASNSLVTPTYAVGSFQITSVASSQNISKIFVGGTDILNQTTNTAGSNSGTNRRALATAIVNRINSYVSSPDYTATTDNASNPKVTITAVAGGTGSNGSLTFTKTSNIIIGSVVNLAGGGTTTTTQTYTLPTALTNFTGGVPVVSTFNRVDIEPSTTSYPKAATRTDCAGCNMYL